MILVNRAGEEIDGGQLLGMIVQKGTPSLRRRLTAADHVFADAAFPTLIPSLSNSPWMRGAPQVGFSRLCLVKTKSTFEINNLKKRDVTMLHAIWLGEITIRHGQGFHEQVAWAQDAHNS
jgi:hypothetical protein